MFCLFIFIYSFFRLHMYVCSRVKILMEQHLCKCILQTTKELERKKQLKALMLPSTDYLPV